MAATTYRWSFENERYYNKERELPYMLQRQAEIMIHLPVIFRGAYFAPDRRGYTCEFYYHDRIWKGFLPEGSTVAGLELEEQQKPRCVSCGREGFCFIHDFRGRCENTLNAFWENVRKLYWHRHSKSKK
jgi:hypothetical protein